MKKRILTLALALTMAAATAMTGCGKKDSASSDTINIGTVFNTTGYMAAYEQPAANGFQLAVDEINEAGGISGKKITYTTINAQSDAAQNASATTKLIDVNNAVVVAGVCEANLAITAGTAAQDAGVPFVTVGATLPDIPDRVGDGLYLAPYGDNTQAYALAEYAYNDLGLKTALALSKYFKERFKELGGEIVLEDSYDENGYTDFSASISKVTALDKKPDLLFFSSFTDQAPIMLQQYRAQGLDMPVMSGDGFDSLTIAEIAGKDANNVYYSTHVNLDADSDVVTKFKAAYKEKYSTEPENAFAALGYDSAYLIKYAIENYIDGDITSDSIKEAIGKVTGFEGVTGTISYENGSHVPTKSVSINKFENGEVVFLKNVG